jgi:hypothetical protein
MYNSWFYIFWHLGVGENPTKIVQIVQLGGFLSTTTMTGNRKLAIIRFLNSKT